MAAFATRTRLAQQVGPQAQWGTSNHANTRIASPPVREGHLSTRALVLASWLTLYSPSPAQAQSYTIDTSAASPLTGLWWNAGESGWGATITQQSDIMFVTMFVYDAAGNPVWYTVSCTISGATCSGDMLRVRGGLAPTAPWSGAGIALAVVGSMSLNFTSNDAGSMSYTLNGVAVTRQIARQIFGPPPPAAPSLAGTWYGAIIEIRNNCTHPQNNGGRATYGQYDIVMGAGTSLQCGYAGVYTTNDARLLANGTVQCSDGKRGSWQSTNMLVTAKAMSLELAVQLDTTETCAIAATLGGSRP